MTIQALTPDLAQAFRLSGTQGVLVASVAPGSHAMRAGVETGDVITAYNGHPVVSSGELPRAVAGTPIGHEVPLQVVRDGKTLTLTAKIAPLAEARPRVPAATRERPSLGMAVKALTPELARQLGLADTQGLLVERVESQGPADNAGIQAGDVIVEVEHRAVRTVEDFKRALDQRKAGTPIVLLLHRHGNSLYVALAGQG